MLVTLISQCEKKALKRTRQVLDSFANRIGDNTWQTVITLEGLNTVKKLLKKTASKSTAVSCHLMRSRSRSELLWIVGQREKFNQVGIVPVNTTKKNILHREWGNNWSYASIIQIASVIAALLHDIGKTTVGFQNKLKNASISGDPYRHEWISICLFFAMISDCKTDEEWLERFKNLNRYIKDNPEWLDKICKSLNDSVEPDFKKILILPLAQLITWLIVTHHRMPFSDKKYYCSDTRKKLQKHKDEYSGTIEEFFESIEPVKYWVKNGKNGKNSKNDEKTENFLKIKDIVIKSSTWQKTISRWTSKALNYPDILSLDSNKIANPIILYLSRISLIFGDHNYSALKINSDKSVSGDSNLKDILIANTDRKTKKPRQSLDEHLLGVAKFTARFAHTLPQFSGKLPVLSDCRTFSRNTSIDRFQWQNKSYALAKKISSSTVEKGFFGVNMASTGCGKTLANARIMYALSGGENVRFTIALGLRILTLQTGTALRDKLKLDDTELAILIGGTADRTLFELNNKEKNKNKNDESSGCESSAEFIDEEVDFEEDFEGELGTIISDKKTRKLLYAPIVSCTIDHIISASENTRGGRHIVPILRLLSGDLILDEPDDFSPSDLPALTRLVHLAGLFGCRLILSSATLTPDFTAGLFTAYKKGRELWNEHLDLQKSDVVSAWFDENKQTDSLCGDKNFIESHNNFCLKRADYLNKLHPKRIAEVLDVKSLIDSNKTDLFPNLANLIIQGAGNLHNNHHDTCPETKKYISIGLVRIAHIKSLIKLAKSIYKSDNIPADTKIHLCCYHSRQLLLLRNNIEVKLDRILNRKEGTSIFDHSEIYNAVNMDDKLKNHIFIVLASPVAEIGRDHDYDWAIIEPSSMRSIIQLAGRICRHRYLKKTKTSNIKILKYNIKALESGNNHGVGNAVFAFPGFEDKEEKNFLLETHNINKLITKKQLEKIDSTPRIIKSKELQPKKSLADLEHAVMEKLLNNPELNFVNAFWFKKNNENRATVHLQKLSPFRVNPEYLKEEEFVCIPDEDSEYKFCYRESAWENIDCESQNWKISYNKAQISETENISVWLNPSIEEALDNNMEQTGETDSRYAARRYCCVFLRDIDDDGKKWHFNPYLGFWHD